MGFIRANMMPILEECRRRPFSGRLLLLGKGDIYFDRPHLERMAEACGVVLNSQVQLRLSEKKDFAAKGYLSGEDVFKMLGFEAISVLDYSDFEGADITHDLNSTNLPRELEGRFDVVIDHGTLEHVFHLPHALENIFKLLKVGGRAITSSPSSNFFDHGFYMFQPTLFVDFYETNRWELNSIRVVRFSADQENEKSLICSQVYEQGMFDQIGYGKMHVDGNLYITLTVATKQPDSTGNLIPQQGYYRRIQGWQAAGVERRQAAEPRPEFKLNVSSSGFWDRMTAFFKKKAD